MAWKQCCQINVLKGRDTLDAALWYWKQGAVGFECQEDRFRLSTQRRDGMRPFNNGASSVRRKQGRLLLPKYARRGIRQLGLGHRPRPSSLLDLSKLMTA